MSNLVARACGVVLVAAVVLKLQGWSSGTSSVNYFSPALQLAAIEAEALVGVWLLAGWAKRGAWLAAVVLFAVLAAVSLYLGLIGRSSCGCFGRVQVSPWASLALDTVCLTGLALIRPAGLSGSLRSPPRSAVRTAAAVVGILLILGSTSSAASRQFARFRGEALILEADVADAGAAPHGEFRWVDIGIENISDRDARLVGGTADCACLATTDLPVTIPAGGRVVVRVAIRYAGSPGHFRHSFRWYTDVPTQPHLDGFVSGRVETGPEQR